MAEAAAQGANRTLLIVDDEAMLVELLHRMLARQGYRVIAAQSGEEALRLFDENRDDVDLVITDLVMPEMDGGALAGRLLQLRPDLRVLVSTGFSAHTDIAALMASGIKGAVMKPYQAEQLIGRVRETLAE